ncbi:hypothetical protein K505DRAFT_198165, partial [Melanomma pulvis-pyrius CBS 109.77]
LDLDDLFDQYVETGLLQQFSDTTAEPSSSDDLAHLFELPGSNDSDPVEISPMPNWETEDAWHKALLNNLRQNPASPTLPSKSFSVYPKSRGKASLSDPELFNFDDLFELDKVKPRLSLSTPSTPKAQVVRTAKKAVPSPERSFRHGIQKASKKSTISRIAKMMRPSHYRPGFQDLWTRKIEGPTDTFNLQLPPNGLPNSPPPSSKLVQGENLNGFFPQDQPYTIAMSPQLGEPTTPDVNYQLTPLSSPTIDANSRDSNGNSFQFSGDNMASAYISQHISNAALSALQTPPSSHRVPMAPWGSDTPTSLDFAFSASPDFHSTNTGKTSGWWNNHNSNVGVTQPSTPTPNFLTSHSRSSSQNIGGFRHDSVAGLGISCDTASFPGFGPGLHAEENNNDSASGRNFSTSASFDLGYTTMYPQDTGYPIGQPLSHPETASPSRSPSLSPQPRFTRRRHSSNRIAMTSTHQRRKSNSSSNQSNGRASVGFVNYTPDDSRKILTGVAPSGSSKTKARREKEAAEKRRKLSQAAVKAVIEAGGDLGKLEKEGLLVME